MAWTTHERERERDTQRLGERTWGMDLHNTV